MLVSEHISRGGAELPVTSRHDAVTRVASPVAEAATVRFYNQSKKGITL